MNGCSPVMPQYKMTKDKKRAEQLFYEIKQIDSLKNFIVQYNTKNYEQNRIVINGNTIVNDSLKSVLLNFEITLKSFERKNKKLISNLNIEMLEEPYSIYFNDSIKFKQKVYWTNSRSNVQATSLRLLDKFKYYYDLKMCTDSQIYYMSYGADILILLNNVKNNGKVDFNRAK